MKSRKELKNKVWYRFVKVVFISALLAVFSLTSAVLIADGEWKELNRERSTILCSQNWQISDDEKIESTFKDLGISIDDSYFDGDGFDYARFHENIDYIISSANTSDELEKIYTLCLPNNENIPEELVFAVHRIFEKIGDDPSQLEATKIEVKESYEYQLIVETGEYNMASLDYSKQFFTATAKYRYLTFFWPIVLTLIIILLVSEAIRRIFYYIVLGSFLFEDYESALKKIKQFRKN